MVHLPPNTRCRFLSPPPCAFLASSPRAWEVVLFPIRVGRRPLVGLGGTTRAPPLFMLWTAYLSSVVSDWLSGHSGAIVVAI
eukprot:scaffold6856_cov124-Isochrysis_galbana.AAC.1